LVVAKVRERLAVSKRMVKKMDMERFNLKQLNEKELKEQYQVTIKNKFAALENLDQCLSTFFFLAYHYHKQNIYTYH
jgi:hypothetical protein